MTIDLGKMGYFDRFIYNRIAAGELPGDDTICREVLAWVGDESSKHDWRDPVPTLPACLGVNVLVTSSDNRMLLVRRSRGVGTSPLSWQVSAAELAHREKDLASGKLDVASIMQRAVWEECGVELEHIRETRILEFGLELSLYQHLFLGHILTDLDEDGLRLAASRAPDRNLEQEELVFVPFTSKEVPRFVREIIDVGQGFMPASVPCIIAALKHMYPSSRPERAFK